MKGKKIHLRSVAPPEGQKQLAYYWMIILSLQAEVIKSPAYQCHLDSFILHCFPKCSALTSTSIFDGLSEFLPTSTIYATLHAQIYEAGPDGCPGSSCLCPSSQGS